MKGVALRYDMSAFQAEGVRVVQMKGVALLCDVSAFQAGDAAYVVKNRLKACHIKEKDHPKPNEHPERV